MSEEQYRLIYLEFSDSFDRAVKTHGLESELANCILRDWSRFCERHGRPDTKLMARK